MAGIKPFDAKSFKIDTSFLQNSQPYNDTSFEQPPEFDDYEVGGRLLHASASSYIIGSSMKKVLDSSGILRDNVRERIGLDEDDDLIEIISKVIDGTFTNPDSSAQKRYYHALKRMKDKGLYFADTAALRDEMDSMILKGRSGQGTGPSLGDIAMFCNACNLDERYFSVPISDDIWLKAIEAAMIFREPKAYVDPNVLFGSYISKDEDIDLIFFFAYQLAYAQYVSDENKTYADKVASINKMDKMSEELASLKKQLADTEARNRDLIRQNSELNSKMGEQKREYDKIINGLHHNIEDIKAEKDEEIQYFCRQNARLLGLTAEQDRIEDEADEKAFVFEDGDKSDDAEVFPNKLPDSGILFLGGHVNLVKKVRPLHPGWRYQSDNQFTATPTTSIKLVFMWSNHMSHSLQEKVFSVINKDIPVIYLTATNLNCLEHEMKQKYNDYVTNGVCCRT